jgi:hypothetical protein
MQQSTQSVLLDSVTACGRKYYISSRINARRRGITIMNPMLPELQAPVELSQNIVRLSNRPEVAYQTPPVSAQW